VTIFILKRSSRPASSADLHEEHGSLAVSRLTHGLLRCWDELFGTAFAFVGRGRLTATASGRSDHRLPACIDLNRNYVGMIGGLGGSIGWNALPTLDDSLLHADRTMGAMELVVKATRVADVVAILVSPPKWRGCRLAIGASESPDSAVLIIFVGLGSHGCGLLRTATNGRKLFTSTRLTLTDLERVGKIVVVSWTAAAAGGTASAVAETITGTGTRFWIVFPRTARWSRDPLGIVSRWTRVGAARSAGSGTMSAV